MIPRYQDATTSAFFDLDARINLWARIELAWVQARASHGETISDDQIRRIVQTSVPTSDAVQRHELETGHDVVAFLQLWTDRMDADISHLIHRGLTSSDLVDTAHYMALAATAEQAVMACNDLSVALLNRDNPYPRLGRTHGQWAEPTTWEHRIQNWLYQLRSVSDRLQHVMPYLNTLKSPGATGHSWFFNPAEIQTVAKLLQLHSITISTQVLPRVHQIEWAAGMLQVVTVCEDIAMEIRLSSRSEIRELQEGGVRVGSSAMPGKRNPIGSENITGMARLARGYFLAIAESATLHNDRDISNSSVERVAVEDLAHVTLYSIRRMTKMVDALVIDQGRMKDNLDVASKWASASTYQFLLQKHLKITSIEAGERVAEWMPTGHDPASLLGDVDQEVQSAFSADLLLYQMQMGL